MPSTRASLKRRQPEEFDSMVCEQLQTPQRTPSPKRAKTTVTVLDDDVGKENIPPFNLTPVNSSPANPTSGRAARALRRNATLSFITPPRIPTAPKRSASFSTSFSNLVIATPPPTPLNLLPFHARVRALLRPTCNDNVSMPGREIERDTIAKFITSFLNRSDAISYPSIYISGSPGCGKTALINSIIDSMANELGETKVISINCMALKNIDALWARLIDEFDGVLQKKRKSGSRKTNGRESVEFMLDGMSGQCILVLDEMDHIASSHQSISSLLNLAKPEKLCVVGIANTHTLTSSLSSSSHIHTLHFSPYTSAQLLQILQSRLATLTSVPIAPDANIKQFLPIVTLTLLTKKVAALTGDVRTLFEILRGAIDLAVSSVSAATTARVDDESFFSKGGPTCSVTPAHILAAVKSYSASAPSTSNPSASTTFTLRTPATTSNSEIVSKVADLGLQARLVLLSVLVATKRVEAGLTIESSSRNSSASSSSHNSLSSDTSSSIAAVTIDGAHLHTYYSHILRRGGDACSLSSPVSRSEFMDLLSLLEGVGLLNLSNASSHGSSPKKKRMRLGRSASGSFGSGLGGGMTGNVTLASGVWVDEVLRGLGVTARSLVDDGVKDVREEEINAIWMREDAALRKELKTLEAKRSARSRETSGGTFMDASMDN